MKMNNMFADRTVSKDEIKRLDDDTGIVRLRSLTMPEVLQALAAAPRSETRVSKKGEPFQTTLKSYVIDFRPLVSNDPAHHRAFINSIGEHKLPKVDFGF